MKARKRELEEKLLLVGGGRRDTVPPKRKAVKCVVVADSTLRNIEAEHADMEMEFFPGIKIEHLNKAIVKRHLGSPQTFIFHVGTNELRTTRNLDFVMGEVYALMATAKRNLPNCRLVLSEVFRIRDISLRFTWALIDRYDWLANALRLKFVDPKRLIEDGDYARDGLHLNRRGKKQLGQLYVRAG